MNIELKYKLYLIDPISYTYPELPQWILYEELLGNLGKIEKDKDVYIDDKFMYHYNSKYGQSWLSYDNI
jgi:hypothetical protein